MQRLGLYPPPKGACRMIPGLEIAGTVVAAMRPWRRALDGRRSGDIAGGRRRLRRILPRGRKAMRLPDPARPHRRAGRRDPGNLLHRLAQPCSSAARSRRSETLLVHARLVRHRHRRDPAGKSFRRPGHRGVTAGSPRKMRRLAASSAPTSAIDLQDRRLRRRHQAGDSDAQGRRRHPRHGRWRLCRAQLRSGGDRRPRGADPRSRARPSRPSTSCVWMLKRLHHTGSTLRLRANADKTWRSRGRSRHRSGR